LIGLKERTVANDGATCFAALGKIDGCFLFKLTWIKVGKFIGDYAKPSRASKENIETFNNGCKILAQRLEVYVDTNDVNKVSNNFPAFKNLTEY
jgi:hypothetical protein